MSDYINFDEDLSNSEFIVAQEELDFEYNQIFNTLDRIGLAINTDVSMEKFNENIETVADFIDYDVSLEDDDVKVFRNKVGEIYDSLNSLLIMKFKTLSPLINKTSKYKTNELISKLEMIKNGQLVKNENISKERIDAFNRKLAVFYSAGYNLESGPSHLITYMENIANLAVRSGKYLNSLGETFKKINTPEQELNIPKLSGMLNVKNQMNGLQENVNRKVRLTDFRLSIIGDWFTSNVLMVMISYSSRKGRGYRVHTDTFNVNFKKDIKKTSTSDTIKLLEFGIRHANRLEGINKSLGFAIKGLARDNTVQLLKSAGGAGTTHRFLAAKYSEAIIRSLIVLYRNICSFDNIILAYVNLMYKANSSSQAKKIDSGTKVK